MANAKEIETNEITIELIYALPEEQRLYTITVDANLTVEQAIHQSTILRDYPTIELNKCKVGIFSKVCKLTDSLHDGDRIEIYRALIADPKEARKKRAGTI